MPATGSSTRPPKAGLLEDAGSGLGGYGSLGCSFVELMAEEKEAQKPKWFVSHAWLEPICLFATWLRASFHIMWELRWRTSRGTRTFASWN